MDDQLSNEELKWGYWYFLHRAVLHRIAAAALAVVGFSLLAYSGWQVVDWLANRKAEEESLRLLVSSTVNVAEYRARHQPLPLEVGTVTAVPAGAGTYDLIAQVKNSNPTWAATTVPFTFLVGGVTTQGSRYFMPSEDKYLVVLGVKLLGAPGKVEISLGEPAWQRVKPGQEIRRPDFVVEGESIDRVEGIGTTLRFTLNNRSPYSYYEAGVVVVMTRGAIPVAVGQQTITDVASGSRRPVQFNWPNLTSQPDKLIVRPEVNVFDSRVFKPL